MKQVQEEIIEAFNETYRDNYEGFEEIKKRYSATEILQTWLEYEGIIGYTRDIIDLLKECGILI